MGHVRAIGKLGDQHGEKRKEERDKKRRWLLIVSSRCCFVMNEWHVAEVAL